MYSTHKGDWSIAEPINRDKKKEPPFLAVPTYIGTFSLMPTFLAPRSEIGVRSENTVYLFHCLVWLTTIEEVITVIKRDLVILS